MRIGVVKSILLERHLHRLTVTYTGGIAPAVLTFDTLQEVLDKYDELVAIEEKQKNVDPT